MLRIDRNAQIRTECLLLHIDPEARFRAAYPGGFLGIFSKKTKRFECMYMRREIYFDGFGTQEKYEALLATQKVTPVPLTTDHHSGRTWWMFQDTFYWEKYSTSEVIERRRAKDVVTEEVRTIFLKGDRVPQGISGEIYRFHCKQEGRKTQHNIVWTLTRYEALLEKQKEDSVQLLSDGESSRSWWMFRDRFYWEDKGLVEIEVKALLLERTRKDERKIERAISLMEKKSPPQTYREPLPDSVKLFVWERDQGRCVQCGRDEELEYDHIIPISKGGSNTEKNIQLLCAACNRSKGANLV